MTTLSPLSPHQHPAVVAKPVLRHPRQTMLRRAAWALAAVLLAHSALLHTPLQWLQPWAESTAGNTVQVQFIIPEDSPQKIAAEQHQQAAAATKTIAKNTPTAPRSTPAENVSSQPPAPQPPSSPQPDSSSGSGAAISAVALATASGVATAAPPVAPAANAKLVFDVAVQAKGLTLNPSGELLWQHDATTYNARLSLNHLFFSRSQTSRGKLTGSGLQPIRFGDKVKSEVAAHFDWDAGKVTFSANTPDVALTPTTQDQLSALLQLGAQIAAAPPQYSVGTVVRMAAIGPRSEEQWEFVLAGMETLKLPGGEQATIKVTRAPAVQYGNRAEIWLAPALGYLPVRIRLIESNGDTADMQWKETQQP